MEPTSGVKTWQWVVTVIVIIVLIVIGILVFGGNDTEGPVTDGGGRDIIPGQVAGAVNRITMTDQYPGNVVYISSVQFAAPGWIAIHKDNNGTPGAVIGSARFAAGINPGRITLTESLVDGGTYYAMMHSDNGDAVFNEVSDAPLKDAAGNVIMKIFRGSAAVGAGLKG